MQIQISWLLKPTDLDLHCLQNRIYPGSAGQGLNIKYYSMCCIHYTIPHATRYYSMCYIHYTINVSLCKLGAAMGHSDFMKTYRLWVPFERNFLCIIWEYACAFLYVKLTLLLFIFILFFFILFLLFLYIFFYLFIYLFIYWGGCGVQVRHHLHRSSVFFF